MSISRVTAGQAVTYRRVNQGIWATTVISTAPTIDDTPENHIYTLNGSAGNVTVTLPTLADNQSRMFTFINDDAANDLIIDGEGAETIGGESSITLDTRGQTITIIGQANEWEIRSGNYWIGNSTGGYFTIYDGTAGPIRIGEVNTNTIGFYTAEVIGIRADSGIKMRASSGDVSTTPHLELTTDGHFKLTKGVFSTALISPTTATQNNMFDLLSSYIPNNGDTVNITGGLYDVTNARDVSVAQAERSTATLIVIYGYNITAHTAISIGFTDGDGSGSYTGRFSI